MMKHLAYTLALTGALAVAVSGCKENQIITPERNLDRPVDVAFFCAGPIQLGGEQVTSYSPNLCAADLSWCTLPDDEECLEVLDERAPMGLVLNSARGELTLINLFRGQIVDLADHQPGFGFVPVGANPTAVATSNDGCAAVTANAGSCDLSVVSTTALMSIAGFDTVSATDTSPPVTRLAIKTDSGRLLARPQDLILKPRLPFGPPPVQACAALQGYRAYVSFPDCALVAEVNLDTGRIVQSIKVGPDGVSDGGTDPECPAQCPDLWGDGVAGDATPMDRPAHLAYLGLEMTGGLPRMYVAPDFGSYVAAVDFDATDNFDVAGARIIPLEGVERGIRKVRASPATFPSNWLFVYVVTRDGDVRVIDGDDEVECETNPDPNPASNPIFANDNWEAVGRRCFEVGTVARAPLSTGPGIDMPGNRQAVDVAFSLTFAAGLDEDLESLDPLRLAGTFAWVLTLDGQVYLVNIDEEFDPADDAPADGVSDHFQWRRDDGIHAVMAHQVRNLTDTRSDEDGRVRVEDEVDYLQGGEVVGDPPTSVTLDTNNVDIIDPRSAVTEEWALVYEGLLPGGLRTTGFVFKPNPAVDDPATAEFRDSAASFCEMGTEVGDVVVILGCEQDSDCGDGFACLPNQREDQENGGVCLEEQYANNDQVIRNCLSLAQGSREYEILEAYDQHLILGVLPAPGNPCDDITDCTGGAICEAGRCVVDCSDTDDASQPVETCETVFGVCDHDGTIGRCIRAPLPDRRIAFSGGDVTWCLPSLLAYEVRAGDQFLLTGLVTGTMMRRTVDLSNNSVCIDAADVSPLQHSRVPVTTDPFENPILRLSLTVLSPGQVLGREDGIKFFVTAGFSGVYIDAALRLPAWIGVGPDLYIYMVDSGDDVLDVGSIDGQLLRMMPAQLALDTSFLIR